MAARIKYNLAHQISRLGDVQLQPKSFKVMPLQDDSKLNIKLSLDSKSDGYTKIDHISDQLKCSDGIERVAVKSTRKYHYVDITVNTDHLIKTILMDPITPSPVDVSTKKNLVIEYSSPNFAKPFHVGHLRSTMIGNFLSNLNLFFGNNVTRMNYLGDWGTQYGYLKYGIDACKISPQRIQNNPIETLYKTYVRAHKLAEHSNTVNIEAKRIFNEIENGNETYIKEWNTYKEYTIKDLEGMYERLGVKFDKYDCESMYNSKVIQHIIDDLESKGIMKTLSDGCKVTEIKGEQVVLEKNDGSSLYLSRDIAAAHDRYTRYNFDEMLYIVDNSQLKHFDNLFDVLRQMDSPIANKCKHIKFGRILGMSTRKGAVIFLKDILDEALEKMQFIRKNTKTTRGCIESHDIADVLGTTAIITYDLMHKRDQNYHFLWDRALSNQGYSATKLQYTHCRLHSIEKKSNLKIPLECIPKLLPEEEALNLVHALSLFEEVLRMSQEKSEAHILVMYLFELCRLVGVAIQALKVVGKDQAIAEQRLLLFHATRLTLKKGMEILGLRVLDEM